MNRTIATPILILIGIIGAMALMAGSNIFTPLLQFIHSGNITPLQAVICLLFIMAGFTACYFLLNLLCGFFVPRMGENSAGKRNSINN